MTTRLGMPTGRAAWGVLSTRGELADFEGGKPPLWDDDPVSWAQWGHDMTTISGTHSAGQRRGAGSRPARGRIMTRLVWAPFGWKVKDEKQR